MLRLLLLAALTVATVLAIVWAAGRLVPSPEPAMVTTPCWRWEPPFEEMRFTPDPLCLGRGPTVPEWLYDEMFPLPE